MRLTKLQMAKVIVQALYNLPQLPADDHPKVVRLVKRETVATLARQHELACKALASVKRVVLPASAPCPGVGGSLRDGNHLVNEWVRR